MKSFLIIGMGAFGHHLCRSLAELDAEIMVADSDGRALEDVLSITVSAKIADCTNPDVLKSFGIKNFDACFVCMGNNFQSSLEITNLLKELGARKVISKADTDIQAKFLLRNGADKVIYPEKDVAENLAISENYDSIFDCIELGADYMIFEIEPPKFWLSKSIAELKVRSNYNVSILAYKENDTIYPMPSHDYTFKQGEHILVLGHVEDIKKLG